MVEEAHIIGYPHPDSARWLVSIIESVGGLGYSFFVSYSLPTDPPKINRFELDNKIQLSGTATGTPDLRLSGVWSIVK